MATRRRTRKNGWSDGPITLSKREEEAKLSPLQEEDYEYGVSRLGMSSAQARRYALQPNGKGKKMKRNTSEDDDANQDILRGFVIGFWLQGWADAMDEADLDLPHNITEESAPEPPAALDAFAKKFGKKISEMNGGEPLWALADDAGVAHYEYADFGYYVAMESLGHGVAWSDSHDDHNIKLPRTEFHVELADPEDEDSGEISWAEVGR